MTVAYSPIDFLKLNYDENKLLDYFNDNYYDHSDHNGDKTSKLDKIMLMWDMISVRNSRRAMEEGNPSSWYKYEPEDFSWFWNNDFEEEFPGIINGIKLLPFDRITWVGMFRNLYDIPLHIDRTHVRDKNGAMKGHKTLQKDKFYYEQLQIYNRYVVELDPCSYRIVLQGDRNKSFIVSNNDIEDDAIFVKLPEDTDTFVFNTTDIWHGARKPENSKILLYVSGFLNKEKHLELLERSMEKYSDYVIRF